VFTFFTIFASVLPRGRPPALLLCSDRLEANNDTIYASKSFKNLAKAVCPQGLALETEAAGARERHKVVRGAHACTEEQVVAADLCDRSCSGVPVDLDVALLVVLDLADVVVVGSGDTSCAVERQHPFLDDAETAAVVEVQHVGGHDVAGEHVSDGCSGAVGLRVKNKIQVRNVRGGGSCAGRVQGLATDLDALDVREAAVSGALRVSLRNQAELSRRRHLSSEIKVE